jgi:hypothetical protein
VNDRELMERTFHELGAVREYMAVVQDKVGKTDAAVARIDERIAGIGASLGESQRRHSDRFARIEVRIGDVAEHAERRDGELWGRVDDRIDRIDTAIADFLVAQADHNKSVASRLTDIERAQLEHVIERRWTMAIGNGVSAVIGGIIATIVASLFGGSCVHTGNESARQAAGDRRAVAGGPVLEGRAHP